MARRAVLARIFNHDVYLAYPDRVGSPRKTGVVKEDDGTIWAWAFLIVLIVSKV